MTTYIVAGLMIVITTLILLSRINLRRFLGYPNTVDITFTLMMLWMFHETFSGIVAGAFAGVFMSVLLGVLRGVMGAERLEWKVRRSFWFVKLPYLTWVEIPASQCRPHFIVRLLSYKPNQGAAA